MAAFRVVSSEGMPCGRVKDVYFDDRTWQVRRLVLGLDPKYGKNRQVLVEPEDIAEVSEGFRLVRLTVSTDELGNLPPTGTVLPVCEQYRSLGFGSPAARHRTTDPHLRSGKGVWHYRVTAGEYDGGTLQDLVLDDETWEVRYLTVEQSLEGRRVLFHLLPESVERFTWATQRVLVRDLQPVELEAGENVKSGNVAA